MHARRRYSQNPELGQASVELVAILPALLLAALIAVQLTLVGYGLWSGANAARAGARAAYVGGDGAKAARSAVPVPLQDNAVVRGGQGGPVSVTLRVPSLLPGTGAIPVRASAGLDPEAGGG